MLKRLANELEINPAESAVRTFNSEICGLESMSRQMQSDLGEAFERTVRKIIGIDGRVIVTGIGKSGHIGAKIAATLASTGTPAFFVHPVEASHGDLGMVTDRDVIIALSWSGESSELRGVITYSRRFSIPLIALTSGARSTLAKASDIVLLLPKEKEACPHGLAPTTSTLMQLAMGDALAVALLEAKGFSASDFKTFHPGGKLGAQLACVEDVMHDGDEVPIVQLGTAIVDAAMVLANKRFGCVAVVDDEGTLCGILTDGDLARSLGRNLDGQRVEHLMTSPPVTISPDSFASAAMATLNERNISALVVVSNDNRPIGIVHFHDLLRIGAA